MARQVDYLSGLHLAGLVVVDPIAAMRWAYDRYGPLVECGFEVPFVRKQQRFVLAVGARYNERVLGDPSTFHTSGLMTPGPRDSAQRRIRSGVVSMNGAQHAHYRRLLQTPLRRAAIDDLVDRIGEIVDLRIQNWPLGEVVDLWSLVKDLSQHVAIATLFGVEETCDPTESLAVATLIHDHVSMASSIQVRACPINLHGLPYWRMLRHAEKVESELLSWAKKRRGRVRKNDLMSLVVNSPDESGNLPTDLQITPHLLTLIGASYETCQTVLSWTLFLLAQHPSVAAALLNELSTPPASQPLSRDGLEPDFWLDAVVRESMRLLPPVPFQVRKAMSDTDLIDCNIKSRTRVILSPFLTNRLPEIYTDGDCFRPERWSSITPSQYEYLVFSAGPRTCIGYWFGMTFLKIAVAHILRRYRLSVVPGSRVDYQVAIALWPSRGIPVTIHSQDKRFHASSIRGNIGQLVRF